MPSLSALSPVAVVLSALAVPATAATLAFEQSVSPTPDYTHHAATVRNDGANSSATNNSSRLLAGSVGSGALRSLFSFDLSAIPAGATINSVSFQIYQEADTGSSVAGDYTVELRALSAAFDETTANWDNTFGASTTLGATALSATTMNPEVAEAEALHTFASSAGFVAAVQDAVDAAAPFNFALIVPGAEGGPDRVIMRLGADEANTLAGSLLNLRPILSVDYTPVPEPSALSLLSVTAAAILRRRRRA